MNSAKIFFFLATLISLAVSPVFGESSPVGEYPSYQNGILTIPRVDTSEQAGTFQDVKIQLTEQGDWRLTDFKAAGTPPLTAKPYVDTVEIIVTETFPVQVFLKVRGRFPDLCIVLGKTFQRLKDNRFEVVMYAEDDLKPGQICVLAVRLFEKIIPLPVYGLSAGTYGYSLSGVLGFEATPEGVIPKTFTDTFGLAKDNKF
jgi:hypothetical protein